jgi:uncharacterized membrane protein YoaK (UPF0700 family)
MPLFYLRRLTGAQRSESANRQLARYLAFIAGAANAGGFLAVRQYTSHMSGMVSAMADNLAIGSLSLALNGLAAVLSFLLGAFFTTLFIRWGRARSLDSQYALPLLAEAGLLVLFGFIGREFTGDHVLGTIMLLCFTMGLQNAIITKISNSVIRTTHLTGMVTDVGIALGRIVFAASTGAESPITPELPTLQLLTSLIVLFFIGGFIGAFGFRHAGFFFTLPLAAVLLVLAAMPVIDDIRRPANTLA